MATKTVSTPFDVDFPAVEDVEPVEDPELCEGFGHRVLIRKPLRPGQLGRGYEAYGFIIDRDGDRVKIAYYEGYHRGYLSAWFDESEIIANNPLEKRPLTYDELVNLEIEL